jgi:DNA-binding MarR family transcriptional regulator
MPIGDIDYTVLAEFRAGLRHFVHFSAEAARSAGLSPVHHQTLLAVKGFGKGDGLTVGEIARAMDLRPNSAVGMVDRMAKAGLVRRTADKADRRKVHVTLTPKGERVLADLSAAHRNELRRLRPTLKALLKHIH